MERPAPLEELTPELRIDPVGAGARVAPPTTAAPRLMAGVAVLAAPLVAGVVEVASGRDIRRQAMAAMALLDGLF